MLNPFPELLFLSLFAPLFLRIGMGLTLFFTSFDQLVEKRSLATNRFISIWPKYGVRFLWIVGVSEIIIGLSFVAGIFVQYFAILSAIVSFLAIFSRKFQKATYRHMTFYVLTFVISLSLLVTGAGKFAMDAPL